MKTDTAWQNRATRRTWWRWFLFALVLVLAGGTLLITGPKVLAASRATDAELRIHGVEVTATVANSPRRYMPPRSSEYACSEVVLTYYLNDAEHTGRMIISSPCERAPKRGEHITIYLDPDNPETFAAATSAARQIRQHDGGAFFGMLAGLPMCVVGLWLLIGPIRTRHVLRHAACVPTSVRVLEHETSWPAAVIIATETKPTVVLRVKPAAVQAFPLGSAVAERGTTSILLAVDRHGRACVAKDESARASRASLAI